MLNRKFYITICFLFIVASVFAVSAVFVNSKIKNDFDATTNNSISYSDADLKNPQSSLLPTTYFVTAGDGILCIYSCTENSQILTDAITYIDLYSLDSNTKQSLESGIVFENRTEVIRFIENISS